MKKETIFGLVLLVLFGVVYVMAAAAGQRECVAFAEIERPVGSKQLYPEFNTSSPLELVILSECGDGLVHVSIGRAQPRRR